jgi:hypothetical protein
VWMAAASAHAYILLGALVLCGEACIKLYDGKIYHD